MFCPKCGTQNPEAGRYCRKCGADLGNVSEALSGNLRKSQSLVDKKGKPINWESALVKIFTGLAFLLVAAVLGITNVAGGRFWWFWMLIPAFGSLGSGIAQYIQLKKSERHGISFAAPNAANAINSAAPNSALPPPSSNLDEIQNLVDAGDKIMAIKVHREIYGTDLKSATAAVEQLERREMPLNAPNEFGAPPRGSIYETGELTAPPSVTENTTRHLKMNSEGGTMTPPKK